MGLVHAEEVVSRTLRDIPQADRPYVFTKCSLVWDESDHSVPPRRVGTPGQPSARGGGVAGRLQVERIDLYQMRWPADDRRSKSTGRRY